MTGLDRLIVRKALAEGVGRLCEFRRYVGPCWFVVHSLVLLLLAPSAAQAVETWADGVREVIFERCIECHHEDGPAPMALTSFEQARPWAKSIAREVQSGAMPPWHAVAGGPFVNERRLSEQEKTMLLAWVEAGAKRGAPDGQTKPDQTVDLAAFGVREGVPGWTIGEPDLVIEMPEEVAVPATGELPYHDTIVDPGFTEDVWVKAAESRPGNRDVVHHIIVGYLIEDPLQRRRLAAQGLESRVQGSLGGYVPGDEPLILGDGLARLIPKGSKIYFQMHYTPNGVATTDRSSLGLVLSQEPPRYEVKTGIASSPFIRIPPGSTDTSLSADFVFRRDSMLLSMRPHMHLRGKKFEYRATYPDGKEEVLLEVDDYDFGWQTNYVLASPKRLPAGTKLTCTGTWDNSQANPDNPDPTKTVSWGQQTRNEMMIGFFEYYEVD